MTPNVLELKPFVQNPGSEVIDSSRSASMRITMISDDFLPAATGVGIHIQSMAEYLVRKGHKISVITTRRKGEPKYEIWKGVEVFRTFSVKVAGFYQALPSRATIERILKAQRPDIIHYHYLSLLMLRTRSVTEKWKAKQVYTYHMTADHLTTPLFMKPFRSRLERLIVNLCNGCDLVLAPSRELVNRILADGVNTPTHFLSNAIYFSEPKTDLISKQEHTFAIFYAGRLAPEKNIPLLIRAFALHLKKHPASVLWIAGSGNQERALVRLCRTLGVTQQVNFLGFVNHDELIKYYKAADVFVLPSTVETQGMVALEAMQFQTPVIVTDAIVSCDELVEEGQDGFIVDAFAPDKLAVRLSFLATNRSKKIEMGRQAHAKAKSYRPETLCESLTSHYSSLMAKA